jgi:transcriptional regulator with XRE-family HTH domain
MRQSIMMTNGTAIRVLRYNRGLTITELASLARVNNGYLSRIERGLQQGTAPVLKRIADALGVAVSEVAQPAAQPATTGIASTQQAA